MREKHIEANTMHLADCGFKKSIISTHIAPILKKLAKGTLD